jgi:hypothetical protein
VNPSFVPSGWASLALTPAVASALATAAAAQQAAALHRAGYYAALADTGNYSTEERVRLRELVSEFTLIAEHMRDALEAIGADVHAPVVEEVAA